MTVAELKIKLTELPNEYDNFLVVLSTDAEGNRFRQLSSDFSFEINEEFNVGEYYFDVAERELLAYYEEDYESFEDFKVELDELQNVEPCIVLWPS